MALFAAASDAAVSLLARVRRCGLRELDGFRLQGGDVPAGGGAERAQDVFERGGEQLVCRLAGGLAAQPAPRRGPVEPGPALQRVAQPRRVLGDVGVKGREQRDGAASRSATTRLTSGSAMSSPGAMVPR